MRAALLKRLQRLIWMRDGLRRPRWIAISNGLGSLKSSVHSSRFQCRTASISGLPLCHPSCGMRLLFSETASSALLRPTYYVVKKLLGAEPVVERRTARLR